MKKLKEKLEFLMNKQGELYFEQIYLIDKTDLEIINTKINNLTEEIFEISNQIFEIENEKLI